MAATPLSQLLKWRVAAMGNLEKLIRVLES